MFENCTYAFTKVSATEFVNAWTGIDEFDFPVGGWEEYCRFGTMATGYDNKYLVARVLLEKAGLRTKSCRHYRADLVRSIMEVLDNPDFHKHGRQIGRIYLGLESEVRDPRKEDLKEIQNNFWCVPLPKRHESRRGYISRLSAWANMIIVDRLERSWDGDIIGVPEAEFIGSAYTAAELT